MIAFFQDFYAQLLATTPLEGIAVLAGLLSVWFSKKEHIWVYPTGLVSTTIFIYLCIQGHLYGEASVNLYYTLMSVYGWWLWSRTRYQSEEKLIKITRSTKNERMLQIGFFIAIFVVIYLSLNYLKENFAPDAIPWADGIASAAAYTGMWLMARKKIEHWLWWMLTNAFSVPLFYIKGYAFSSLQFALLLLMAIWGWMAWNRKLNDSYQEVVK